MVLNTCDNDLVLRMDHDLWPLSESKRYTTVQGLTLSLYSGKKESVHILWDQLNTANSHHYAYTGCLCLQVKGKCTYSMGPRR
jgi:hypothetical protein